MASPAPVRSSEDTLARSRGRGQLPAAEPDAGAAPLTDLPDHQQTSDEDLLSCLHQGDALALAEVYQRTAPAAHAVARRLLTDTRQVEAALRSVYRNLWLSPPHSGSLTRWVRARCFAVAAADLARRGAAPSAASLATVLEDLPTPGVQHLTGLEQALLDMPERNRRAVILAHDAGVPAADQPDPDAADLLEVGLLALSDVGSPGQTITPSGVAGLGDWALGLLPAADGDAVGRQVAADAELTARAAALRRARRRLEGLPASQNTNQRVLAHVVAGAGRGNADETAPQPQPQPDRGRNHRAVAFVAASVVLVLLAGVMALTSAPPPVQELAVAQSRTPRAEPPRPAPARERAPRPQRPSAPRIVPPARTAQRTQPAAPPVRVTIPKIQVDKKLVGLSVLDDGTLAAPEKFETPGWYRDGVMPGDAGPAVIVGHVDSLDGPAVFFKLETLKPGDKAHVKRSDGTTVTFVVDRVERVPKDSFPTERVYGPTANPELRLITCGGAFDNTTLSYDDNVIAFAHLEPPRRRGRGGGGNSDERKDGERQDRDRKPADGGRTRTRDGAGMPSYDHLGRLQEPEKTRRRGADEQDRARPRSDTAAGA